MALLNVVHYIRYFATTQLYAVFVAGLVTAIFVFAWKSSTRRPLNYYGWLVRLDSYMHRRYLDVMPIRPSQDLRRSSFAPASFSSPSTSRRRSVRRELPIMSTSTVVIQTPATVMTHNNTTQEHDHEMAYHQLELPPSQGESEDAEQIHRYISERTNNPSVATAVVMALVHNNSNRSGAAEQQQEHPVADSQQHRQIFLSQIRSNTEDGQGTATVEDVFLRFESSAPEAESESSDSDSSDDESDSSSSEENQGIEAVVLEPQRPPTPIPAPLQMPQMTSGTSGLHCTSANLSATMPTVLPSMSSSSGDHSTTSSKDLSTIRLKFLDDTQQHVRTWLDTSVGDFKKNFFTESVDSGRVVRLIYQGQLLRDDARSLQSYGLHDDCVVHCHVGSVPYAQPQRTGGQEDVPPTPESMVNVSEPSPSFTAILSTGSMILRPILSPFFYFLAALFHVAEPYFHRFMAIPSVRYASNMIFENYRRLHNLILGPSVGDGDNVDEVAAASDRAANSMRISLFRPEAYLGTLFTVKIAFLWSFVLFYPQYTDREAIILLLLVTVFFVSYIRCSSNRTPPPPPTN